LTGNDEDVLVGAFGNIYGVRSGKACRISGRGECDRLRHGFVGYERGDETAQLLLGFALPFGGCGGEVGGREYGFVEYGEDRFHTPVGSEYGGAAPVGELYQIEQILDIGGTLFRSGRR